MVPQLQPRNLQPYYLKQYSRWIRDVLDPQIAQAGPDALQSDDVLTIDEFLRSLYDSAPSVEALRASRIHFALLLIAGRGTRWPSKLIDRCDHLISEWSGKFGPLGRFKPSLFQSGGRLYGICKPEDMALSQDRLLATWLASPDNRLSPAIARKQGCLGFRPGDWWISPLFAHRAGIIDTASAKGGIISDAEGIYAVILADADEVDSHSPEEFVYRAHNNDPGRYRLTSALPNSRNPIRILRNHTLHSLWKPKAGIRYDGLHVVVGWSIKKRDPRSNEIVYLITFKRLSSEAPMDDVLRRPWSDEVEDYTEYKRLRSESRRQS